MFTKIEEPKEQRDHKKEQDSRREEENKRKLNPRLVFNDPKTFFDDLIMEQMEQG